MHAQSMGARGLQPSAVGRRPRSPPDGRRSAIHVATWVRHTIAAFCIGAVAQHAFGAEPAATNVVGQQSVVQILAYDDGTLLNQGSGVVAGERGIVLTNAHLLNKANRIVIRDADGKDHQASIVNLDATRDVAVLRGDTTSEPLPLSQRDPAQSDTLEIIGYWNPGLERPKSGLFVSGPKFVAQAQPASRVAKALVSAEPTAGQMELAASLGRGAYGAAVVNRCGELVGLVHPDPKKPVAELLKPHLPVGAFALIGTELSHVLGAAHIPAVAVAQAPCLTVAQTLETEKQRAEREAAAQAKKSKEQLAKERAKAEQARRDAQQEREAREHAEKERDTAINEAAETKHDAAKVVSDVKDQAEQLEEDNTRIADRNRLLLWALAGGAVLALLIVTLLVLRRRRDIARAKIALRAATATFGDCRFSGANSQGNPIAFIVLGKDLLQRDSGLLLGRNPEKVQVVVADQTVSREHARLFVRDNRLHIQDLGSTTGTSVNGNRIEGEPVIVITGDTIRFGDVKLSLTVNNN